MLLKDYLKEVYKNASLEKNDLVKENTLIKWVHRFGFDSLDDLLQQNQNFKQEKYEEEKQESLNFIFLEHSENKSEELIPKSNEEETLKNVKTDEIGKQYENQQEENPVVNELPLPEINKFRKWINKDKEAS